MKIEELREGTHQYLLPPVRLGAALSTREVDIAREIATGKTNREIGIHLNLSEQTIKNHIASLFIKTGSTTRIEVLNSLGWISTSGWESLPIVSRIESIRQELQVLAVELDRIAA